MCFPLLSCKSGTKIQPKEEVFGRISLRISLQKLRSLALQILEKQAFRNGHPTRTSMKKLQSEKLRADFSFPSKGGHFGLFWSFNFLSRWLAALLFRTAIWHKRASPPSPDSRKTPSHNKRKQKSDKLVTSGPFYRTAGENSKEGYWGRSERGRGNRHNSCAIVAPRNPE